MKNKTPGVIDVLSGFIVFSVLLWVGSCIIAGCAAQKVKDSINA
jgi:hypothetical protein